MGFCADHPVRKHHIGSAAVPSIHLLLASRPSPAPCTQAPLSISHPSSPDQGSTSGPSLVMFISMALPATDTAGMRAGRAADEVVPLLAPCTTKGAFATEAQASRPIYSSNNEINMSAHLHH